MVGIYLEGLSLGFSLIVAIGAQNAYVMRQGIRKEHTFATAALCTLIDLVLIAAGALGLGSIISSMPILLRTVTFLGAAFVAWYGLQAFIRVFRGEHLAASGGNPPQTLGKTLTTILVLSLLNPHVYLDTVLLLGTISSRHPLPSRFFFVAGAGSASALWFFSLCYGAGFLSPLFEKSITWKIFDTVIGLVMGVICIELIRYGLKAV